MRKLLSSLLLFLLLLIPVSIFAQSPSPQPEKVDVYALFWPVVPGQTVADGTFFIKQIKEAVSGFFKQGNVDKAGYLTELSEKRMVEANKLVENKDFGNALKSLQMNEANRNEAIRLKKKAAEEKADVVELTTKMVKSLENQQKALNYLVTFFPSDQQSQIQKMVNDITLQISEAK